MNGLVKPTQPYYVPPDILNFPTQNKELAKDFNFMAEMFKFFSKTVNLSFEDKRLAGDKDTNTHELGGWKVTDEWYQALNEYSIPQKLASEIAINEHYNRSDRQAWEDAIANGTIKDNEDVINNVALTGVNNGQWGSNGGNWVSGFVHFSSGLDPNGTDYFWGENVGASLANADFDAQANEWNHLEQKEPLGLAGLGYNADAVKPKEASLDADVNQAYFINDFLSALGYNWSSINGVLNKFPGLSYYEIVMNKVEGRPSYSDLSTDGQMIANMDAWLNAHSGQALSHGVNSFRILLENSHQMLNQIYQFSKTTNYNDAGYSSSMLDRYAFWQYNQDCGAKYFNQYNPDNRDFYRSSDRGAGDQWSRLGDGSDSARGAIFNFIESKVPGALENSAIRDYLMKPLSYFSLNSRVGDMPDPPPGTDPKLKAMKWLIEQWFGASNRVSPGYNSVPKPMSLKAFADYDHGPNLPNGASDDRPGGYNNGYTVQNIAGSDIMVPNSIRYQANSAQSYGWDRVAGPWDDRDEHAFFKTDNGGIGVTDQWLSVYGTLRSWYGLAYISPAVNNGEAHNNYIRKQFAGLNRDEIMGKAGNIVPYLNSWAVRAEGDLTLRGERTDKIRMNIYNFMEQSGTRRYKRAEARYQEKKDDRKNDEADEEKMTQKIRSTQRAERKQLEQKLAAEQQQRSKAAHAQANKPAAQKPKKA